jgi:hypothetical protein
MKRILFSLLLCTAGFLFSKGQCVVYACDNTGAFGAGFNNDNTPTTYQECTDFAIKLCKEKGGTACAFLYKSAKAGWWGVINGKKTDGRNYFQGGDGYASKAEAEEKVRAAYKAGGGANADNIKVYTWYSYSNVKN